MSSERVAQSPLGRKTPYIATYTPSLLYAIPRRELGIGANLPFHGVDIWNAYEVSWLNAKGKPEIAVAEFHIPADSPNLIEAKSFKLYLNSYNQTRFGTVEEVRVRMIDDLSREAGCPIEGRLMLPDELAGQPLGDFSGACLDHLDVTIDTYQVDPELLTTASDTVEEKVYSHLLKSNCLVTGQPDWGSVYIHYTGPRIDHAALLRYLISFRQHNEFHEQCIERIFMDITKQCRPTNLTVFGKYTRRGGLDINPFRSNFEEAPPNFRLPRQ